MANLTPKDQMSFRELYKTIENKPPKLAFVERIAEITMKSESTVRGWLAGNVCPDALNQSIISKELGIPSEVLFPPKTELEPCDR